jgi:hypothetical protein
LLEYLLVMVFTYYGSISVYLYVVSASPDPDVFLSKTRRSG